MQLSSFLVKAIVYVVSFGISLYALGAIDYEKALKAGHVREAQILYFLLAMALGYLVGSFLLGFLYIGH